MPRKLAVDVLEKVERTSCPVADAVRRTPAVKNLGAEDLRLFWEIVHGVVRHRDTLDHVLVVLARLKREKVHPNVHQALRVGVYQMVYLDRVPVPAAVYESVEIVKSRFPQPIAGFVNGCLRSVARALDLKLAGSLSDDDLRRAIPVSGLRNCLFAEPLFPDPREDPASSLALRHSHPRWLVEEWLDRLGAETTEDVLRAGNEPPTPWLRPSPERLPDLERALRKRGVRFETEEDACPAIRLLGSSGPVHRLPGYGKGWFAVQDRTAMKAGILVGPLPGERILDLCAAPGGKTAHLAQLAGPTATVVAVDRDGGRLELLRETCERLGIGNVSAVASDAEDAGLDLGGPFDRVLADVPCSNTGVLSKRVEVRHRVTREAAAGLARAQLRILRTALRHLAPGGTLVYSTCSLLDEENGRLVRRLLEGEPEVTLESEIETLPRAGYADGGYLACLVRPR